MSSSRSWLETPLEDVCESIIDCVNKTAPSVDYTTPYKMIRTTNVRDGWVSLSNVKCVEEEIYRKWIRRQQPKKGDVILTREAPLGEVGMLRSDEKVFLGQRLVSYRANPEKIDKRFLLYAFQGHYLQAQIKALGSGSTVEHMRVPDAKKLKILLPSLSTQRAIGSILSSYDDLIANNTRRIEILEEMARRLYEEWFVHFRFPGHEDVSFKQSELGEIPEGWEVKGLYDIAEVTYGHPFKAKQFNDQGEGLGAVRIRDIRDGQVKTYTTEEGKPKHIIENGDILVGMDGQFHMGKWAGGKAWLVQRVARFRPTQPMSRYLLFLTIERPIKHLEETIVGTTVAHLSAKDLKAMKVVVPDEAMLKVMADTLEPMYELEMRLKRKNVNLHAQRDLLLPKLVSGEIDVSDITMPEDKEVEAA